MSSLSSHSFISYFKKHPKSETTKNLNLPPREYNNFGFDDCESDMYKSESDYNCVDFDNGDKEMAVDCPENFVPVRKTRSTTSEPVNSKYKKHKFISRKSNSINTNKLSNHLSNSCLSVRDDDSQNKTEETMKQFSKSGKYLIW
jgi:hypothetical protein